MIDGVNTKVEVTAKMFSEELKELIQKKETIINDLDEKEKKKTWDYLKINFPKHYELTRKHEEFEKTNPSEIEREEWFKNNVYSEKTPTEEIAGASS